MKTILLAAALLATSADAAPVDLVALYKDLHAHPELGFQETRSAGILAAEARAAGWQVTEKVGGTGVVAVLKNGPGPTVLVRADMDALPVKEITGLPYASQATGHYAGGPETPVMHACGHDIHMTVWAGVVRALAEKKAGWRGTVIMVAQPAEEIIQGARAMLADGLYARFGRPDYALALHDGTGPAGTVQVNLAANASAADTVDIEVKGVGGHGAYPADTKDPVVLASRIVLALQTLVSRENDPFRPAVVTVGSIHGGTKHNIIGESVHLQLTVRSFDAGVQTRLIEGIRRIARGEAIAAGLPETLYPEVKVDPNGTQPTINTTALATRIKALFQKTLGPDKVLEGNPSMASEDYNQFGLADPRIQTVMYSLGAVNADVWAKAQQDGTKLPGPHNPRWAPDPAPTIATGVATMTDAVMMLLPAAR